MVEIKSNKATLSKSSVEVFNYLCIPANYQVLMPSKVRSFEATDNTAKLDIEGIGSVELAITERISPTKIMMVPQNKVPFKFDIHWNIVSIDENTSEVEAIINADLNFMMKMMAEKLLTDFLNIQVHKLSEYLKG
jgi:hypothetical protein